MRITKSDQRIERHILIGLIVSDEFTREIISELDLNFFQNKAVRTLVKWCIDYFHKYGEPPKKQIQVLYEDESDRLDEDVQEYLGELLQSLSEQYDLEADQIDFNAPFYLDRAIKYFKKRQLKELASKLEVAIENDKVDEAEILVHKFKPVERKTEEDFDPFALKEDELEAAFQTLGEPLFALPGPLGKLMNLQFYRSSFIAFQGAEKVGKTWFLQELMFRALRARRRVAFFEAGDLTKEQRLARLYSRLAGKPWVPIGDVEVVKVPAPEIVDEELMKFEIKEVDVPVLTAQDVIQAQKKFAKLYRGKLRFSVHANSTLTPKKIDNILEEWELREDWVPDVIIIDYADILASDQKYTDQRSQINQIWKDLRALSQKWQCSLITATQADAASYKRDTQSLSNFSEDKRKYAHVTAMFALNRTEDERRLGALRVTPLLLREGVVPKQQVGILSNPAEVKPWFRIFWTDGPISE